MLTLKKNRTINQTNKQIRICLLKKKKKKGGGGQNEQEHMNRLPSGMAESPSLEKFTTHLDAFLGNLL